MDVAPRKSTAAARRIAPPRMRLAVVIDRVAVDGTAQVTTGIRDAATLDDSSSISVQHDELTVQLLRRVGKHWNYTDCSDVPCFP